MSRINVQQALNTFVHDATSSRANATKARTKDYVHLRYAFVQKGIADPDSTGNLDEAEAIVGKPGHSKEFSDLVKDIASSLGVKDPFKK